VVQNVTTYGTVIDVPNAQLKLKPGMTANVKVEIAKRTDVPLVPNAALRFRPTAELFAHLNQSVPPEAGGGRGQGGTRTGRGTGTTATPAAPAATAPSPPPAAAPAASAHAAPSRSISAAPSGQAPVGFRGGRGGGSGDASGQSGGRGGFGGGRSFDPARMMERFKSMSPEEQEQFIARMKNRGVDTSPFEQGKAASKAAARPKPGAPAAAQTIDALFAPLPVVETRGRAWLFMNTQLSPKNLRLRVSDGTNTELLSTELQQGMQVVTGVTGLGTTRALPGQGNPSNPMMPGGGRGPGGGGFGGGGRGR
jgi:hypothetical protein